MTCWHLRHNLDNDPSSYENQVYETVALIVLNGERENFRVEK